MRVFFFLSLSLSLTEIMRERERERNENENEKMVAKKTAIQSTTKRKQTTRKNKFKLQRMNSEEVQSIDLLQDFGINAGDINKLKSAGIFSIAVRTSLSFSSCY